MNAQRQFSLENLLMSTAGHLIAVALLITSVAIVLHRAKLVTPDRIQIMEIDLSQVRVAADETKLYNTSAPTDSAPAPEKQPIVATPPAPDETKPIESTTLVDDTEKTDAKQDSAQDNKSDDKPAQKKTTVVRVNRETVSLDRTLTVSVIDALRVAMTRCWNIDTTHPGLEDIRAVAHLTMNQNGTVRDVWFESAARAATDAAFAYVLDTIRNAIAVCQPLRMLPAAEYEKWRQIQLTFYPTQGTVM